ncbi:hypothetical protein JOM56_011526 [Amanita muscaria]
MITFDCSTSLDGIVIACITLQRAASSCQIPASLLMTFRDTSTRRTTAPISEDCRHVFEPLFLQYSVNLVLSGHVQYQRNAPIRYTDADPNELNNPSSPWIPPKTYGWSKLTFHNCTHLTHEFVASANGTVLDTATQRSCHGSGDLGQHDCRKQMTAVLVFISLFGSPPLNH